MSGIPTKIKSKSRIAAGRPRKVPPRDSRRSGDSVLAVVERKSGPNKGRKWLMRFYTGPDGKRHSAPAKPLPASQKR